MSLLYVLCRCSCAADYVQLMPNPISHSTGIPLSGIPHINLLEQSSPLLGILSHHMALSLNRIPGDANLYIGGYVVCLEPSLARI